ncbi:MAG: hypothetical protein KatS3mg102_1647 [Planctomycetota bacterium]|nr:MAG: hypothetical protein KatS3mg102_1647 [Planctomycetota bacterium]
MGTDAMLPGHGSQAAGRPRRLRVLQEHTVHRPGQALAPENPYWAWEEPEFSEHPAPERGCIRRGLCCRSNPGWFAPGEVEKAAALLGLEPDAFVRRFCIIDALELEGERVEVFAPLKLGRDGAPLLPPGSRADALYRMFRGTCIFYDEPARACRIYPARPLECRRYICTNRPSENLSRRAIAGLWRQGRVLADPDADPVPEQPRPEPEAGGAAPPAGRSRW